ncbi:MAG: repressor LexA [Gaiellaceae bacterium]|nr:repressor LexA [Gaiellaceae bacterium]
MQLTKRQQEILRVVQDHIARHGYPPTVREIGDAVGLTSSSTVHAHLQALESRGALKRDPTKPRAIDLRDRQSTRSNGDGVRMLPLLGAIAAGTPILAEQNVEEEMAVPGILTTSGECFLLRVRGESMILAGILDGDYVVVRRQPDCADGDIVAALVDDGEATVKRLDHVDGRVRLIPENDAMEPFHPEQVDVLGKIVGVFRRM